MMISPDSAPPIQIFLGGACFDTGLASSEEKADDKMIRKIHIQTSLPDAARVITSALMCLASIYAILDTTPRMLKLAQIEPSSRVDAIKQPFP